MKTEKTRFEIKPEHLKLLSKFIVGWQDCEFGAPEIDPKRPYGNSDVIGDMAEILKIRGKTKFYFNNKKYEVSDDGIDYDLPEELEEELKQLHQETQQALQICLRLQKFETGVFEVEKYSADWKRVLEKN